MAQRNIAARLRLATNTDLNWQALNPVLLNGERVIVSDLQRTKTGNGTAAYNALPFDDANIYVSIAAVLQTVEEMISGLDGLYPSLPDGAEDGAYIFGAVRGQGGTTYQWMAYELPVFTILERIELLEKMVFTGEITNNPYMVLFDDLAGVVAYGVWNQALQCLEC